MDRDQSQCVMYTPPPVSDLIEIPEMIFFNVQFRLWTWCTNVQGLAVMLMVTQSDLECEICFRTFINTVLCFSFLFKWRLQYNSKKNFHSSIISWSEVFVTGNSSDIISHTQLHGNLTPYVSNSLFPNTPFECLLFLYLLVLFVLKWQWHDLCLFLPS